MTNEIDENEIDHIINGDSEYETKTLTTANHRLAICAGALRLQHSVKINKYKDGELVGERFEWETVPIVHLDKDGKELPDSGELMSVDIGEYGDLFDSVTFPVDEKDDLPKS